MCWYVLARPICLVVWRCDVVLMLVLLLVVAASAGASAYVVVGGGCGGGARGWQWRVRPRPSDVWYVCGGCAVGEIVRVWRSGVRGGGLPQRWWWWWWGGGRGGAWGGWVGVDGGGGVCVTVAVKGMVDGTQVDVCRAVRRLDYAAHLFTYAGLEQAPVRTGALSQRVVRSRDCAAR